ncbi:mechanosensitive ion channel family protein [Mycobacterium sp.]|uniref:mechanosensitive ion channel family protein n=1 Tax=Mycobacterium sp. TaxID=1785 RepID=UPI002BEB0FC9|nr:mechanosensitive ion channel family protein [Mycobacterium sp.]HKP41841.1 mechanosensitive ion channel family protein [Mycobacterium sp.]
MNNILTSSWFYWAVGVAVGLPVALIALTEWQHALDRRKSFLVRPVSLLRNYLLPLGALLLLLVKATQIPTQETPVKVVATLFGFVVMVLLLSGINATIFQSAPEGTWRKRIPAIFVDVARFLLIAVGLAIIFSYVWGAHVRGLFTALGVGSIVIGLTLQHSVGQIISGLLMLFEQPFKLGDWIETSAARGRVVEVNWRAVHIDTGSGLQITPNSILAVASFTNLSRPPGVHKVRIPTAFSLDDPPDRVCAVLSRVAGELPQLRSDRAPKSVPLGGIQYRTTIPLRSPADDGDAKATFLRWIWYAARREGLHLDEAEDDFSTPDAVEEALRRVVAPTLRLTPADQQDLASHATVVRYGADEIVQHLGEVPTRMTFIASGRVRVIAPTEDGSLVPVTILNDGSFLGQTALTRQPVLAEARALVEVTAVQIGREHIEEILQQKPLLLQEFGRLIEERRGHVKRALAAVDS